MRKQADQKISFNAEIAQRAKKARVDLGLTQRALALKAGLRQQQISSLESGKRSLTSYGIVKLAKALGVTTDYLLTGETERWESELLERFSSLPEPQKEAVKTILDESFKLIQSSNNK